MLKQLLSIQQSLTEDYMVAFIRSLVGEGANLWLKYTFHGGFLPLLTVPA